MSSAATELDLRLAAFVGSRCAIPSSILECRFCARASFQPTSSTRWSRTIRIFIFGNNVLAQCTDINDFVAGIRRQLKPGWNVGSLLERLMAENQFGHDLSRTFVLSFGHSNRRDGDMHDLRFHRCRRAADSRWLASVYLAQCGFKSMRDPARDSLA